MGCYYHPAVPTAVRCRDCGQEICGHCSQGEICPGCRLNQAMHGTPTNDRVLNGSAPGQRKNGSPNQDDSTAAAAPSPDVEAISQEDRLLAGVCYVLWPLALLVLLLRSRQSRFLKFNVVQSLSFNALGVILYIAYVAAAQLPIIGWQSALFVPFLMPAWFLFDLYLGLRAYGGYTTRVPIAAEYASKHS